MPSCKRQGRPLSTSATHSVVVGAAAGELRRALGPTSWVVLEELLLCSTGPADACVAQVSVRALAASLGLAKDTVGRAIRRLRYAGLVTVAQQRTDAGIFDTGTYLHRCSRLHHSQRANPILSTAARSRRAPRLLTALARDRVLRKPVPVMTTRMTDRFEEQTSARTRVGKSMLRVTTLYASSRGGDGELLHPISGARAWRGRWCVVRQAGGRARAVGQCESTEALELLLEGRDPVRGTRLGYPLADRTLD